ncbi:hypothetical protein CDLVIII_4929 [Clostridium sp. DL-VIII]|nr:hypothetical protein CDLVIII_4929 [Clostridium sp. DL-VIII]
MTIIAIISIGIYNGYVLLIRQTKVGQEKQMAAITGKRIIEEFKNVNSINDENGEVTLQQDDKEIVLNKATDDSHYEKTLHLDNDFNICADQNSNNYSYIQEITLTSTKNSDNEGINIDKNNNSSGLSNANTLEDHLYLSKSGMTIYINDDISNKAIESQGNNIRLYIYLKTNDDNKKVMTIKGYQGNTLLEKELGTVLDESTNKENVINLYINFNNYSTNSTSSDLKNFEIYISNKNEEENSETNMYLQKSNNLNVNLSFDEGHAYIYNNQAEDGNKIGGLYDIEVKIKKKDSEDYIFTGYSNQNININYINKG